MTELVAVRTEIPTELPVLVNENEITITEKWLIIALLQACDVLLHGNSLSLTGNQTITIPVPPVKLPTTSPPPPPTP